MKIGWNRWTFTTGRETVRENQNKEIIFDDYVIILDFPLTEAVLQTEEVSQIKWMSIEEIKRLFYIGEFMFDDRNWGADSLVSFVKTKNAMGVYLWHFNIW